VPTLSSPIDPKDFTSPDATPSGYRVRLTSLIVACALFMQSLDSTAISTALPDMARSFGADPVQMSMALTSYLLSLAVFIPASGWVADRYGTQTVFRAAIVIFTLGSVLCGRTGNLPELIAARILQGAGGAMMVPVGRLVLLRTAAKSELVGAMAWLSIPALSGPVVGPPLGGFIVTYLSWRWIFDINLPIGILGVALVTRYVADIRESTRRPFDVVGLLLTAFALSGMMLGLESLGRGLVSLPTTFALISLGTLAAAAYSVHARHQPAPLLDLALMRLPTFAVSVYAGFLFRIGVGATPFLLPLMLQVGFGWSAASSGIVTFASSAGAIIMKPCARWILRRFGFRTILIWNAVISAIFIAACAMFRPTWPLAGIYAILLAGGFFRSLQFTAYNTIAYADVPEPRMSAATSLYATFQQLSLTLGIIIGAGCLGGVSHLSGHAQPSLADFSWAFVGVATFTLFAGPLSQRLSDDAGSELSGNRRIKQPQMASRQ